jgi:hypothetical protein
MIKKIYTLISLIFFFEFCFAQTSNPEFQKTVDSINIIIKANPLAYYSPNKQYSEHIIRISATQHGMISFTDSITKPEIDTLVNYDKNAKKRPVLIPDCCPPLNSRTLDLFVIKNWGILYPYLYLKDANNESFAKFLGFQKPDLEKLKEQFEKLTTLCKKKESTTK